VGWTSAKTESRTAPIRGMTAEVHRASISECWRGKRFDGHQVEYPTRLKIVYGQGDRRFIDLDWKVRASDMHDGEVGSTADVQAHLFQGPECQRGGRFFKAETGRGNGDIVRLGLESSGRENPVKICFAFDLLACDGIEKDHGGILHDRPARVDHQHNKSSFAGSQRNRIMGLPGRLAQG